MKKLKENVLLALLIALASVLISVPVFADDTAVLRVVDIDGNTAPALKIAVQAGAGLCNRNSGGSVYTRMNGKDVQWLEELALHPDEIMDTPQFLEVCMKEFPRCVLYSYSEQQALLPNILTVAAVLEAIPIAVEMDVPCDNIVFDATEVFKEHNTPYLATKYVYDKYVNDTTGLAMLNPGYSTSEGNLWDPALSGDMNPVMIDFVFSEKLFVMFLINGCIKCTEQRTLLNTDFHYQLIWYPFHDTEAYPNPIEASIQGR